MERWLFLLLFLPVVAFGQFRMVSSTVTLDSTVNDSTYIIDVDFFSDQTAKGYFASGITADYRVFSQTGQLYDITAASNLTLSSGQLTIVEIDNNYVNTESAPVGQILVFDPQGDYITFTPFGNSNMGQVLQQAIGTYNAVVSAEGGSVPEWSGTANYEQFKQVSQDGKIYTNRTGTNTTTPPSSDLVNWELTNKSAILEEIEGRDTISQASHPFSVGDPLWYSGNYILAQDTGSSVRVDGIVVEVIDANTFVKQRSGKFTLSSHGFTANIQLYVQPDGTYGITAGDNALAYGYAVSSNEIEIGLKPDKISTRDYADFYDNTLKGLIANTKQGAIDELKDISDARNLIIARNEIAFKATPTGSKIFEKRTSTPYFTHNKDSIVVRTSGAYGIAALPANDTAVWAYRVDNIAVIDNGSDYAFIKPEGGVYKLSSFSKDTSLTHSEALQRAVDYAAAMMRIFSTPSSDTTLKLNDYVASNTVLIDGNYTFTDTLLLRHGVALAGNFEGSTGRNYVNQCAIDLNDNTKYWLNLEGHGGNYFQGGGVRNLSFYFLSEAAGFGFIENPGSFTFHNVRIDGISPDGNSRLLEDCGIKVDGMIFNNWHDIFISGVNGPGIQIASETPVFTSTTTVWNSFRINDCEVGVKSDYNGIIDVLRFNDFSFERIDSNIAQLHANSHTIWDNVRIENVPNSGPANGGSAIPLFQVGIDSSGASTLEGTFILNNSRLNVISGNQDSTNTVAFEIGKMLRFSMDHVSLNNYYCPLTSTNYYTHIALGQVDFTTSMKVDDLRFSNFEGSPPITNIDLYTVDSGTGKDGSVWDGAMSFNNDLWGNRLIGVDEVNVVGGISKTTRNTVKLLNNGTDNGTLEIYRTGNVNIQLNGSANSYIFGPTTNALRLGVGQQFPLKTLHVGGAQGDLQVDNGLFFTAFGNASTKSLSTLGLSKGTHPYPVFASDGTLANESSIPASDINSAGDSSTVQLEITGLDARIDALELTASYGEAYIDYIDPDSVIITTAGTLYDFTDVTEGSSSSDVTVSTATGRLTYTGLAEKIFEITWTATVTSDAVNENLIGTVLDNDATITRIRWEEEDTASGDRHSVSASGFFSMGQNDWVQPKLTSETNGTELQVITMSFKIQEVR